MLYSSLTGKASGFKCRNLSASWPAVCHPSRPWCAEDKSLSVKPELLPDIQSARNAQEKVWFSIKKVPILVLFPCHLVLPYLVIFCLADDIPVNSNNIFCANLGLDPKYKACSFVTYDSQPTKSKH